VRIRTRARHGLALGALVGALAIGCTTGETSEDQHTRAVRDLVRDAGYTEDVAECIVDQVEATIGLAALEDADADDALTAQINEIATSCLLVVPTRTDGTPSQPTKSSESSVVSVPQDPEALTTTTGAPRGG
jgi:hypothetical protein